MSSSVDRVSLLLRATSIGDPTDPTTWSIEGRHPTADEIATLLDLTLGEWESVHSLLTSDLEISETVRLHSVLELVTAVEEFLERFPDWGHYT